MAIKGSTFLKNKPISAEKRLGKHFIQEYQGTLVVGRMDPDARGAFSRYSNQRARCENYKCNSYKDYGGKGIQVEYTVREFIAWYLASLRCVNLVEPSVGRVDHSKNYTFDNIELIEFVDNVKERNSRLGNPTKSRAVVAFDSSSMTPVGVFSSMTKAGEVLRVQMSSVRRSANASGLKRRSTRMPYSFQYFSDVMACSH